MLIDSENDGNDCMYTTFHVRGSFENVLTEIGRNFPDSFFYMFPERNCSPEDKASVKNTPGVASGKWVV